MATINQSYNGFAAHAREATEKSVEALTSATKPFTASATAETDAPTVLAEPAQRYLTLLQRAVVANLELATKWTELVVAFSGASGVLPSKTSEVAQDSAEAVIDVVQESTEAVVDVAKDVTDVAADVTGVAASVEPTETDEVDEAAERAEAKHAHELARQPYLSLTKSELSALLAERGLPKTGTINTLVERLVSADAQ